jgi:dihydrofolate synthase/folylpolyglutamate synthase
MTYPDAIEFLYSLRWFGAKFGLTHTFKLADLAGNPQNELRFVHVAGTNGKGSTSAMLESIYRTAGLRVGLFTSPHLVAFSERIQVNRQPILESEVAELIAEIQPLLKQFPTDEHPTFFEVVTVMALRYFAAQNCDLVIWETGLGGRLDATNIVNPLASVITNIHYDHQKYLGESLASIAGEKAGIIKPRIPVITGAHDPEALAVIRQTAHDQNAPLTMVQPAQAHEPPLDTLSLPLLGEHQRMNAAVALAVVRTLGRIRVPASARQPMETGVTKPQTLSRLTEGLRSAAGDEVIRNGLSQVHWPGRLQLVIRSSGQKVLLDGAHNLNGAESLAAALRTYFPEARPVFILGILRDKDWSHMCELLAPLASRILLVPVHSERTAEPHGLAEVCRRVNRQATVTEHASLEAALSDSAKNGFVAIAGSLYLIGEAMELLQLSPAKVTQERGLNEWTAP